MARPFLSPHPENATIINISRPRNWHRSSINPNKRSEAFGPPKPFMATSVISIRSNIQCSYEMVVMKIKKWTLYDVKMTVFLPTGGTREMCYGFQMRSAGIIRSKFSKSKCFMRYNLI